MTQFEYNEFGKVKSTTDPVGRRTLFVYSTNAIDLLEVRQVVGSTNELLTTLTYNASHAPLSYVDASGQTTYFAYNSYGQLTAITNALDAVATLTYSNAYLTNITSAFPGAITSLAYDSYGRARSVTDSEGYTVTFDYDALDRHTRTTYPDSTYNQVIYDRLDPVLQRDRSGHWTRTIFNAVRQPRAIEDAAGRITHFEWCGCGSLERITDPKGRVTTWFRDLQGRVTAKLYPDSSQVQYAYEARIGRLKTANDAKNQTTRYDYFSDNNLKSVSYSNAVVATPTVSFTYHSNYNRIERMLDGIGTNTYAYHAVSNTVLGAGRLQSIDGPLSNDTISYTYDELGRVKSRAINNVAQRITYDALGRVTVVTNVLGTFSNGYVNAKFRLSSVSYPNGQTATFSHYGNTNDQRLETIWHKTSGGSTLSKFDYAYDADGQIKTWTQQADNGTPKVYVPEYDPVDQLLSVTIRTNGIAGAVLKRYVYGYDTAGNRMSQQIDLGVNTGTYNSLNQLTTLSAASGSVKWTGRLGEKATVQVAGLAATMGVHNTSFIAYASASLETNNVQVKATDYSNNSRTNTYQIVLTNNGTTKSLFYDANGNLTNSVTSTSTNEYEWDGADRLVRITQVVSGNSQLVSEFTYDGLGRRSRIVEKANGITLSDKRFLWCSKELCEERDSTGATTSKRFFRQGEEISGSAYFFSRDHLGSIREMTDTNGAARARYEFDAYGKRTKVSGDLEADFAFTGHFYHQASGLHLTLFRALDVETGTWLSRDPIEEKGGLNLYAYAFNDPMHRVDPDGAWSIVIILPILGIIVIGSGLLLLSVGLDGHRSETKDTDTGDAASLTKRHERMRGRLDDLCETAEDVVSTLGGTSVSLRPPGFVESGEDLAVELPLYILEKIMGPRENPNPNPNPPSVKKPGVIYFGPSIPDGETR